MHIANIALRAGLALLCCSGVGDAASVTRATRRVGYGVNSEAVTYPKFLQGSPVEPASTHPAWFREDLERLFGLLATRAIRPRVAERISFEEVA